MKISEITSPKIALCLSGGGLRATYFHLGVIIALRRFGLLVKTVDVFSVSGGSITAAHLIKNWARYTGSDADFDLAVSDIRRISQRDIRGRIIRRTMLFFWLFQGISYFLQREYKSFFGNESLKKIYRESPSGDLPSIHFLATSMNTGQACRFSRSGLALEAGDFEELPWDSQPMNFAIAASSAFPPLIPPLKLTPEMLGGSTPNFASAIHLSDGGVYDNLGFDAFLDLHKGKKTSANCVIISNASGAFRPDMHDNYRFVLSRNVRASDILMQRVADRTLNETLSLTDIAAIPISISCTAENDDLAVATQKRIQHMRTDLDIFSSAEVDLLIGHGYRVAMAQLAAQGISPVAGTAPDFASSKLDGEVLDKIAEYAQRRSISIVGWRDWATYALIVAAAGIVGVGAYPIYAWWQSYENVVEQSGQAGALKEKNTALLDDNGKLQGQIDDLRKRLVNTDVIKRTSTTSGIDTSLDPSTAQPKSMSITHPKPNLADNSGNATIASAENKQNLQPDGSPQSSASLTQFDRSSYRVWLQFSGAFKRQEMVVFGQTLKGTWPNSPGAGEGGERIEGATINEVRYSQSGGALDQAAASELTNFIQSTNIVANMGPPRAFDKIRPGSLEIWISK